MMGDNRFNSLDMRHKYESTLKNLVDDDPYSIKYGSYLEPQYVSRTRMLGKAVLRFWPLNRFGTQRAYAYAASQPPNRRRYIRGSLRSPSTPSQSRVTLTEVQSNILSSATVLVFLS